MKDKSTHPYFSFFSAIKKLDKKYSDQIEKYSLFEEDAFLLGIALKNKARILRIEKYLHERGKRK